MKREQILKKAEQTIKAAGGVCVLIA